MGLKLGIIGLPNVGKSTIFNAITQSGIPAENYPFCTIDPNVGIVKIPDARLYELSKIFNPKKTTPTFIEFVDIAGLVSGASKGEGLGNKFLSHIRDVDAIIHVVRMFEDANISHVSENINPIRDIETIETELLLKDIETIESRISKLIKLIKSNDKELKKELEILENILPKMNQGLLVKNINIEHSQKSYIDHLYLLTVKPILYVANIDENQIIDNMNLENIKELSAFVEKNKNILISICGNLESEIATLPSEEKKSFLLEYNLQKSGLDKLIYAGYNLLELETFFTVGADEVRAWTINKGTLAPQAAGKIHTDIERGFIKAEVYSYSDILSAESENSLREMGKIRQEGKNYIVNDGDIIFFKFNV
tara:strand:- start:1597 stop:2697 length:1101 start_codon:yes stop_codon:yes gene_type:complete